MTYQSGDLVLNIFVDSDYDADTLAQKSLSGFIIKLGAAALTWGATKQAIVSLSTSEAEYHAITQAAKEDIWIKCVPPDCDVDLNYTASINSDNQKAIDWSESEQCPSTRAKQIDINVHFIREQVRNEVLVVNYVPSEKNDADLLIKPLGRMQHRKLCEQIGISSQPEEEC